MAHDSMIPQAPETPSEKPKPTLRLDLEDIEGMGEAEIGDTVVLTIKAKVKELSQMNYGEDSDMTHLTMEISSVKLADRDVRMSDDDAD